MDIQIIAGQVLGIIAMALTILSMQFRSNRHLFLCQELSGTMFAISFYLLGAWGGMLMNIFSVIRPELLRREKIAKSKWTLAALLIMLSLCLAHLALCSTEKWYLLAAVGAAQAAGTYFMWTQNGKIIRIGQVCCVSPLWITYNCLLPVPSIGGIVTEAINIISIGIALFRYRKTGFTEK